jgi:hemerythrin
MMPWKDDFNLGIDPFDTHHEHLFELLNNAYDNFVSDGPVESLGATLDALVDYATYHFSAEEKWMKGNNYPKYAGHLNHHGSFIVRVVEMQVDFAEGRKTLSLETLAFLKNWLSNHILTIDADYGRYAVKVQREMGVDIQLN